MEQQQLIDELARMAEGVPGRVDVPGLRPQTPDAVEHQMQRLLNLIGEQIGIPPQRMDLVREDDRTVMRLPLGGRVTGHHASGAIKLSTGMPPMEKLIGAERPREELVDLVRSVADRLDLPGWTSRDEELVFERLWQIKAGAADQKGARADTVVCRAIGAYRHVVHGLPVWGPASAAVQVAADSEIDTIRVFIRSTTGSTIDTTRPIEPREAARQVVRQLSALVPESDRSFSETATPVSFRFGYLNLSKHTPQTLLPPVYVAEVNTDGTDPMSYLAVVPATEKEYLPVPRVGSAPVTTGRRATD